MDAAKEASRKAAQALDDTARAARTSREGFVALTGPVNAFGLTLEETLAQVGTLTGTFNMAAAASDNLAKAQTDLQRAMGAVTTAALEVQLRKLVSAQVALYESGRQGSIEFFELTKQIGATETQLAELREANAAAAKSNDDVADSAGRAAGSLRNYESAAGSAAEASRNTASSVSQVSEEFGNIGRQSSAVEISLGNLSESFVRAALAAAGTATSARDYADSLSRSFEAGQEIDAQIQARIEQLARQNRTLTEEDAIRSRLIAKYGDTSVLLEKLVAEELRLAAAKRETNSATERGLELEERRVAGALGSTAGASADAAPAAVGSRGGGTAGARGDAPVINVTVNGLPTDQAQWNELVSSRILPALQRIDRLSR
jgi:hypothetical protein